VFLQNRGNILIAVVIPTLNPDRAFLKLAGALLDAGVDQLVIVNDGSRAGRSRIFRELEQRDRCKVLHHARNLGKGRALKTAFNYLLVHEKRCRGAVTADADGQHSVADILRVVKMMKKSGSKNPFVLGVRDLDSGNVPWKSRCGNKISRLLFKLLARINVQDTQTGLRGIPRHFMRRLLDAPGERFDFESTMLIKAGKLHLPVEQLMIDTIYLNGNAGTNFNPLTDSWQICKVLFGQTFVMFMLFVTSGLLSFAVDIGIFSLLMKFITPGKLFISTVAARLISSVCNYCLNRNFVFKYTDPKRQDAIGDLRSLTMYYLLCVFILAGSYYFTRGLIYVTAGDPVVCKVLVDTVLFLTSFTLQNVLIFRRKKDDL